MDKEYLKAFTKEEIFDLYDAIVRKNKKGYYDITKNKMIDAIKEVYEDYHNIISICTLKELRYLKKMITDKNFKYEENEETDFIVSNLDKKLLIKVSKDNIKIMDGLEEVISLAITKMNVRQIKKWEGIVIPLLGLIKVMGVEKLSNVLFLVKKIYNVDKELDNYLTDSLLFSYYAFLTDVGDDKFVVFYRPYLSYVDELCNLYKNKEPGIKVFNEATLISIFYYDYDKNDKKVSKLMQYLGYAFIRESVNLVALFDSSRTELKKMASTLSLTPEQVDTLVNKIPSGTYGGLSKEQYAKDILENQKIEAEMAYNYVKQDSMACLDSCDVELFYKTYFAVLEYTNKYYHVNKLKIYKKHKLDPREVHPVIVKFYENKDFIIDSFINENPYKFNDEELEIVKEYKKAYRDVFLVMKYDSLYTSFVVQNNVYMVKGLNVPIDEIIFYQKLPCPVMTILLPFKNNIIYDSILNEYMNPINMKATVKQQLLKELEGLTKIYRL